MLSRQIFSRTLHTYPSSLKCVNFAAFLKELVEFLDPAVPSSAALAQLSVDLPREVAECFGLVLESMYLGHPPDAVQEAAEQVQRTLPAFSSLCSASLSSQLASSLYGFIAGDDTGSAGGASEGKESKESKEEVPATAATQDQPGVQAVKAYVAALRHCGVTVAVHPASAGADPGNEEATALAAARAARCEDPTADVSWTWGTHVAQRRAAALCDLLLVPDLDPEDDTAAQAALATAKCSVFCPKKSSLPWELHGCFRPFPPAEGGEGKEDAAPPLPPTGPPPRELYTYGDLLQGAPPLFMEFNAEFWAQVFPGGGSMAQLREVQGGSGAAMGRLLQQQVQLGDIDDEQPEDDVIPPGIRPQRRYGRRRTGVRPGPPVPVPVAHAEQWPMERMAEGIAQLPAGGAAAVLSPPSTSTAKLAPTSPMQSVPVEPRSAEHLVGEQLAALLRAPRTADLLLHVAQTDGAGDFYIPVHRSVLVAGSSYFRSVLSETWAGSTSGAPLPPGASVFSGLTQDCIPLSCSEQACTWLRQQSLPQVQLQGADVDAEDGPATLLLALTALYTGDKAVFRQVFRLATKQHVAAGRPVDASPLHTSAAFGAALLQTGTFIASPPAVAAAEDILVSSLHSDTVPALAQLADEYLNSRLTEACSEFLRTRFTQLVYPLSPPTDGQHRTSEASRLGHAGVFLPHVRSKLDPAGVEWPVTANLHKLCFVPGLHAPLAGEEGGANAKWTAEHLTIGRVFWDAHGAVVGWTPLDPSMTWRPADFDPTPETAAFGGGSGQATGGGGANRQHATAALRNAALGGGDTDAHLVPPVAELPEHLLLRAVLDSHQQADEATVLQGILHWSKRAAFAAAALAAAAADKPMKRKGPKFLKKRMGPIASQPRKLQQPGGMTDGAAAAAGDEGSSQVEVALIDCVRAAFVPGTSGAMQAALACEALPEETAAAAVRFAETEGAAGTQLRGEVAAALEAALAEGGEGGGLRWGRALATHPRAWTAVLAAGAAVSAHALTAAAAASVEAAVVGHEQLEPPLPMLDVMRLHRLEQAGARA